MLQGISTEYRKQNMKSSHSTLEKKLSDLKLSPYNYLYKKKNISAYKLISNAFVFVRI